MLCSWSGGFAPSLGVDVMEERGRIQDGDASLRSAPDMRTTRNEIAVEIVGLNKWFGAFHVLRDLDLKVTRGERIVICGPSGSGKDRKSVV